MSLFIFAVGIVNPFLDHIQSGRGLLQADTRAQARVEY